MTNTALTRRQREVLTWISQGCPDGVMSGNGYKVTAIALQNRRLVDVSKRAGAWSAKITDAGQTELVQPVETQKEPGPSKALLARVLAAGGALHIDKLDDWQRYDQLTAAVNRSKFLPTGKRLIVYRDDKALDVVLEDCALSGSAPPNFTVLRQVRKYCRAVELYRADNNHQEVSQSSLNRASEILQAFAANCDLLGYTFEYSPKDDGRYMSEFRHSLTCGQFTLTIHGHSYHLRVSEKWGKTNRKLTYVSPGWKELPKWQQTRYQPFVPTGILRITVGRYDDRVYSDGKLGLEEQLPKLLRRLELSAWEADRKAEQNARVEARRKERWEQAVVIAKQHYEFTYRFKELKHQADSWAHAEKIRRYLSALRERVAELADPTEHEAARQWLDWASVNVDLQDPLRQPLRLPTAPEPTPDELQPYLRDWSAHGPQYSARGGHTYY